MRPALVIAAAVSIVASLGLAAPAASASSCPVGAVIKLDEIAALDPGCALKGDTIDVGYGLQFGLPEPGASVTGSAIVPAGSPEIPTVTVHRDTTGAVAVFVGKTAFGSDVAIDAYRRGMSVAAPTMRMSQCNNSSYLLYGWEWSGDYKYWYNSSGQPSTAALARINAGIAGMASGVTACGYTIGNDINAIYQTTTTAKPAVGTSGCTGTNDSKSTVGWGSLSGTLLAYTCDYHLASVELDADIKFDTSGPSWYYGTSTSGCSGSLYDLQAVATHEGGHAMGLDHVAQGTGQVMKPTSSFCETGYRKLGDGDATGMSVLY